VAVDGDRSLNVRERDPGGGGRPFLLVHGLASNSRLWDFVSAELAARGHRVVAVDQRGHGLSDRAGSGYRYPEVTGDLVALCAAMGLEQPVLVGQSWGGNVVIHAGALHPTAWHAIAAVDGGTIRLSQEFDDPQAAWEVLRPPPLAGLPVEELRGMIGAGVEDWPDGSLDAQMANFEIRSDGTVAPHLALADHRQIVEAMLDADPAEAWPQITVPVLLLPVLAGPVAWAARKQDSVAAALDVLADGRVRWLEGHHDVHLQRPQVVAEALLELV
jgi:pimeloyl-ACP methyl ester carboxylesterase